MTYEEALRFIHSMRHGGPDLARMRRVLRRLGDPDEKYSIIHVAGTNGKGSVSAYIESILRCAGYRTGLFTSPFVTRFNERIRVDGGDIPDGDLAEVTERVRSVLEELGESPAEFELVTLTGLTYFAQRGVDAAVVEVGMGGPRDATNVISRSDISVFTNIGLDHTQYLGGTVEEIAALKSGIVRPGGLAAAYCDPGGEIARTCRERGAELEVLDTGRVFVTHHGMDGCGFDFGDLRGLKTPLAGTYQPFNAALAVTAVRMLAKRGWSIGDEAIRRGIETVRWQGRFELVHRRPDMIIDGGHNPQAVRATVESLEENYPGRKFIFIFGVMADKDVEGIIDVLAPAARRFFCITPPAPRALPAVDLAALLRAGGLDAEAAETPAKAVSLAVGAAGEEGVICALGSLYTLEDVRRAAEAI